MQNSNMIFIHILVKKVLRFQKSKRKKNVFDSFNFSILYERNMVF